MPPNQLRQKRRQNRRQRFQLTEIEPFDHIDDVTVCITYYQRGRALGRLLESLDKLYPTLPKEIIDTQSNLSWGRNQLSNRCKTKYYFMLEEDMQVIDSTCLLDAYTILENRNDIAGIGGTTLEPGPVSWFHEFWVDDTGLIRRRPSTRRFEFIGDIKFQPCELVLNFGLFRNEVFQKIQWNEDLPIAEHTEYYYRASQQYLFAHLDTLRCLHHRDRPNKTYNNLRARTTRMPLPTSTEKFETLRLASIALKEVECEWFLSDGCVLGYLREGNFIAFDPDLDIGTFQIDRAELIKIALQRRGFDFKTQYGIPENGLQYVFYYKGTKLDLFFYYPEAGNCCSHSVWKEGVPRKYLYTMFKLEEVAFQRIKVNVPKDTLRYVTEQYGSDWITPDKNWNWWSSPHNLVI